MAKYFDGLDEVASALASAGRRQLVATLTVGPATSTELARTLGIGLPGVHKHLAALAAAELITSRKIGRVVTHRLRVEPLQRYDAWLAARTAFWQQQLNALADSFGPTDVSDREDTR